MIVDWAGWTCSWCSTNQTANILCCRRRLQLTYPVKTGLQDPFRFKWGEDKQPPKHHHHFTGGCKQRASNIVFCFVFWNLEFCGQLTLQGWSQSWKDLKCIWVKHETFIKDEKLDGFNYTVNKLFKLFLRKQIVSTAPFRADQGKVIWLFSWGVGLPDTILPFIQVWETAEGKHSSIAPFRLRFYARTGWVSNPGPRLHCPT